MAVAILVLQALTRKSGTTRSSAEQEAAGAHIGRSPDKICDALEAEHRVVDEKRNRIHAVRGITGARGDERSHRASFGNSLFEDLPILGFFVVEQRVHVDGFILLA